MFRGLRNLYDLLTAPRTSETRGPPDHEQHAQGPLPNNFAQYMHYPLAAPRIPSYYYPYEQFQPPPAPDNYPGYQYPPHLAMPIFPPGLNTHIRQAYDHIKAPLMIPPPPQEQGHLMQGFPTDKGGQKLGNIKGDLDPNDLDWPNGQVIREYMLGREPPRWKDTKWVWRSTGHRMHNGQQVESRTCMGVIQCSNPSCGRLVRPKTEPSARRVQITAPCKVCQSDVTYHNCNAKAFHYTTVRSDVAYSIWEHEGVHSHARPPKGLISQQQEDAIDEQVRLNSDASAHQLRTGKTGPGSIPLSEIDGTLANPRTARYQLAKSQMRLNIAPAIATKGGLAILKSLADLGDELKQPFLINSSIHGPTFLLFQTPFMRGLIEESIGTWVVDSAEGDPAAGRHGFVTDGDHSFFNSGVLMVTCVFNPVMTAWLPVLYSWILRQDILHHRPHFKSISREVVNVIKEKKYEFQRKFLLHVTDFSASQRAAHAEEYADALIELNPFFNQLTPASQEIERKAYINDAQEAEMGCEFHFWQSATRLKSNGLLIPPHQHNVFDHHLRILLSAKSTQDQCQQTVETLRATFPRIHAWLAWWMRPKFASMIFPALSVVDPAIANQVPSTSNPVEHQHSLLHHAVGINQDLIPGIKKLFLHVQELEAQYKAIKVGHFDPSAPREKRPVAARKYDVNDGRAPDTLDLLHPQGMREANSRNAHYLSSYRWRAPNSCFFDHGIEIWFRAYALWPQALQKLFLDLVVKDSFLGTLIYHYDRRLKEIYTSSTETVAVTRNLEMMQTMSLHFIFKRWKLYHSEEYGCCMTWLRFAIKDQNASQEIQGYFGISHIIERRCSQSHSSCTSAVNLPETNFRLNSGDIKAAQDVFGETVSLTEYFAHAVPRRDIGQDTAGTTVLHTLLPEPCQEMDCTESALISSITTHWPQIFTITSDRRGDSGIYSNRVQFRNSFYIKDLEDGSSVTYELVGRVLFENGHFFSQLRFEGCTYNYNDLRSEGQLTPSTDSHLLESPDVRSVYYVYHRSSSKFTTSRKADQLRQYDGLSGNSNVTPPIYHVIDKVACSDAPAAPPKKAPISKPLPALPHPPHPQHLTDTPGFTLCTSCERSCSRRPEMLNYWIECGLCSLKWHFECVESTLGTSDYSIGGWCCPACVHPKGGRWDKAMIGEYILLRPQKTSRYFPAEIFGRSSTNCVHLHWHCGNVYQHGEEPDEQRTTRTPVECYELSRDDFQIDQSQMGVIEWPIWLHENSVEIHHYSNAGIEAALESSYVAIKEILLQTRRHPIVPRFEAWYRDQHKVTQSTFNFTRQFDLEILPGDEALVDPFLSRLRIELGDLNGTFEIQSTLAHILFRLVVIRSYLRRDPCDDDQIFWLAATFKKAELLSFSEDDPYLDAKMGCIIRILTSHERVMKSSEGHSMDKVAILAGKSGGLNKETKNVPWPAELHQLAEVRGHPSKPGFTFFYTTETGLCSDISRSSPSLTTHRNIGPLKYTPSPSHAHFVSPNIVQALPPLFLGMSNGRLIKENCVAAALTSEPSLAHQADVPNQVHKVSAKRKQVDGPKAEPRRSKRLRK